MNYFFDSYALIEILLGSPRYTRYSDTPVTTTVLNLIEVTYYFLDHYGEEKARKVCAALSEYVVDISSDDIMAALRFRLQNKKKSLSYADCIGYAYAMCNNLGFLTGDDAFKGLRNVEFVK